MTRRAQVALQLAALIIRDAIGVGGLVCIVRGVALMSVPVAWIVAGFLMSGVALALARRVVR